MAKKLQTNIPGVGFIFRSSYKDRKGQTKYSTKWTIRLTDGTRRPTGMADQAAAFDELVKLAGQNVAGLPTNIRGTVGELLTLSLEDAIGKGNRSLRDKKSKLEILRKEFGALRITEFKPHMAAAWLRRQQMGKPGQKSEPGALAPATKNLYMAELRHAFKLGMEADPPLCARVPKLPKFEVDNVREVMLDAEDYVKLRDAFQVDHARLFFVLAYHLGMRSGEIFLIKWEQVDFERKTIRLRMTQAKGKRARVAPIYGEMTGYLEMAKATADPKCDRVIQLEGEPVFGIRKAWATACRIAGLQGLKPHDMRRTAVTNMIEAGIPADEVMAIIGHKTNSMLRRYMIESEKTAQRVGRKMDDYAAAKLAKLPERKGLVS